MGCAAFCGRTKYPFVRWSFCQKAKNTFWRFYLPTYEVTSIWKKIGIFHPLKRLNYTNCKSMISDYNWLITACLMDLVNFFKFPHTFLALSDAWVLTGLIIKAVYSSGTPPLGLRQAHWVPKEWTQSKALLLKPFSWNPRHPKHSLNLSRQAFHQCFSLKALLWRCLWPGFLNVLHICRSAFMLMNSVLT